MPFKYEDIQKVLKYWQ